MASEETTSNVKSAARFADILEFVADSAEPPTFPEIAVGLGLPRSSLFNLLGTLTARGYLQKYDRRGGYQLGPSIGRLADRMRRPPSYAGKAQLVLKDLSASLNETCGYYELHDDEAEVMKAESGQQLLAYSLHVGDRAPLYCISAGKVLLAALPPDDIDAYLSRTQLRAFTPRTLTSIAGIHRELDEVRATGFGYSREEYGLGIIGIATAVHSRGRTVGALGVAMPSVRYTAELDIRIRRELAQAASAIERNL